MLFNKSVGKQQRANNFFFTEMAKAGVRSPSPLSVTVKFDTDSANW